VPLTRVAEFERDMSRFMDAQYRALGDRILKGEWDDALEGDLKKMLEELKKTKDYTQAGAA
jgi:hypothetical protein